MAFFRRPGRLARCIARAAAAITVTALGACSSLPPLGSRPESHAIADVASTPLAALLRPVIPPDGRSAFRLMPDGPNALATRFALARAATRSLDLQYYILAGDNTGRALMRELRAAATRGVRVRVLLDDLYTAGEDDLLLDLAAAPGVEVRLFNPFPSRRGGLVERFVLSAFDFGRLDRRMHNKLFVADNNAAVAGGRNMADAYVSNADGSNFLDMDVFIAGPVVRELSSAFDRYWNSDFAYPVQRLASNSRTPAERLADLDRATEAAKPPAPRRLPPEGGIVRIDGADVIVTPELVRIIGLPFEIADGKLGPMVTAAARVLVDPPDKISASIRSTDAPLDTVSLATLEWLRTAKSRVKMVSPYFIPDVVGLNAMRQAARAGLAIDLVTNSLASTDEPLAYAGYRRHIGALLEMGARIYEISPSLSVQRHRLGLYGPRKGALHMKSATRDGREVFLGSMNFDLRSARLNTELGLIIESPELAAQLQSFSDPGSSYQVRLAADGSGIEWVAHDDSGVESVYHHEPETSFWTRLKVRLLGRFVSDREL